MSWERTTISLPDTSHEHGWLERSSGVSHPTKTSYPPPPLCYLTTTQNLAGIPQFAGLPPLLYILSPAYPLPSTFTKGPFVLAWTPPMLSHHPSHHWPHSSYPLFERPHSSIRYTWMSFPINKNVKQWTDKYITIFYHTCLICLGVFLGFSRGGKMASTLSVLLTREGSLFLTSFRGTVVVSCSGGDTFTAAAFHFCAAWEKN